MRNIWSVYLLLLSLVGYAQIKNGSINYGIITSFDNSTSSRMFNDQLDEIQKAQSNYVFTLNFNTKEASFFVNPSLENNGQTTEDFCSMVMVKTKSYEAPSDGIFRRVKYVKEAEYIMNIEQKADWELTNETKTINGYLCYKATSIYHNSSWNDNPKFNIIAWYTPRIPVPFGPNGYHGLPGLILEVQTYTTTLFVKKIDLNLGANPKIDKLDKGVVLTREESRKISIESSPPQITLFMESEFKKEDERNDEVEKRILERKAKSLKQN